MLRELNKNIKHSLRSLKDKYNRIIRKYRNRIYSQLSYKTIFNQIYLRNAWKDNESSSGSGSNLQNTMQLRKELVPMVKELGVRSVLDVPCGDYNWMKHLDWGEIEYIGGDIVSSLIQLNNSQYGSVHKKFIELDLVKDKFPDVDLIFCRDCLVHFSNELIKETLKNIKKQNAKFLMTTSFSEKTENVDIVTGAWRAINLEIEPFNFPSPKLKIAEDFYRDNTGRKYICVWDVEQIPDYN